MERQVKKWQMKQVLRKYFAEVTHWCKVEINLWFGSRKSENTPWSRLTSFPPPSSTLQFSLYEWLVVKPVMTLQQECESVGRTIWILFPPLLHSTSCRVHVWSPLQCHVYPGSWKSRAVLEIKEKKGPKVCGCFITWSSLNVAYTPVTKILFLLKASAASQILFQITAHLFTLRQK